MAMEGYRGFLGLLVSALLVGFLSVIFTLIWVLHYREGLGWDGSTLQFNWHPVLVVTGFVFIQGIGTGLPLGDGGEGGTGWESPRSSPNRAGPTRAIEGVRGERGARGGPGSRARRTPCSGGFGRARGPGGPGIRRADVGKRWSGGSGPGVRYETRCGGRLGAAALG